MAVAPFALASLVATACRLQNCLAKQNTWSLSSTGVRTSCICCVDSFEAQRIAMLWQATALGFVDLSLYRTNRPAHHEATVSPSPVLSQRPACHEATGSLTRCVSGERGRVDFGKLGRFVESPFLLCSIDL